ncbi:hypothetical protein tb265_12640 [Gemmatimonadetes bacterium T265]|nr:hypothetical protein tb265_12640 [Gemmatimonadetes bacterium T265]
MERLAVRVRHHQHRSGRRVLGDHGDEAVPLREVERVQIEHGGKLERVAVGCRELGTMSGQRRAEFQPYRAAISVAVRRQRGGTRMVRPAFETSCASDAVWSSECRRGDYFETFTPTWPGVGHVRGLGFLDLQVAQADSRRVGRRRPAPQVTHSRRPKRRISAQRARYARRKAAGRIVATSDRRGLRVG